MSVMEHNSARRWMLGAIACAAMTVPMRAQERMLFAVQAQAGTAVGTGATSVGSAAGQAVDAGQGSLKSPGSQESQADRGVVLDRVVAVVNGDMILESDVDEERRFEEIQPYRSVNNFTRERAIERLIDRTLILQQAALEPEDDVSDKELDAQLLTLRKDIPECKQYRCETDEGWQRFIGDHGFTAEEFKDRWRKRMQLLKFIEVRFRNGVTISEEEIRTYYEKTMLPEYAKRNVTPPKLEAISKRIEEVLLQQQVSALLEDWLKSLRAQGNVRIMTPGEVSP
jgi:peptidyl-prolyl cis-trans isomerase SurA